MLTDRIWKIVFGRLMKTSNCPYPWVAVPPSISMVYVLPTSRLMVPPAGIERPLNLTSVIELRFCEIRCSTYSSRGAGVEAVPEPSVAVMWYRRVVS